MMKSNALHNQMFDLIESYLQSGQSQKQFCFENNLSYSKFIYWLKKYRSSRRFSQEFIPLNFDSLSGQSCIIELPTGIKLQINQPLNPKAISDIIAALESNYVSR
jgi:hypothetical protein